ncbi:MAG: nucleotidyltransferase domain-containing protein [Candidatus Woesearchaeota archaeon]|nr:nucleotidyltransferase domain-containing protein [Candidatus Woesearchaeota archaeon]
MVGKTTDLKLRILDLYRKNYLARFHIREMALYMKKSHVTLLPHLDALEKDNILTVKISGKNKEYTLNFDNILTKHTVLLTEIAAAIQYVERVFLIKKLLTELFELNLKGTVVLFGSYSKGTFTDESDIDLLYIGKLTKKQEAAIKNIGSIYGKKIDLKVTQKFKQGIRKKDPLFKEIIKNHILLQRPDTFIDTLWRYYDEIR